MSKPRRHEACTSRGFCGSYGVQLCHSLLLLQVQLEPLAEVTLPPLLLTSCWKGMRASRSEAGMALKRAATSGSGTRPASGCLHNHTAHTSMDFLRFCQCSIVRESALCEPTSPTLQLSAAQIRPTWPCRKYNECDQGMSCTHPSSQPPHVCLPHLKAASVACGMAPPRPSSGGLQPFSSCSTSS